MEKNIIILDIETTGLDPLQAEITEIGAIKVNSVSLEVVGAFDKLIKIANPVPEKITELTGITSELLNTKGKNLKNVLKELSEFCGGYDIYAHNANFDKGFIRKALDDNKIEYHQSDWVDTITIFKKTFPNRTTYKLSSLIVDYKLADKEDHRALSDAQHLLSLIKLARETETADIVKNVVKKQKEKPFVDNAVTIKHTTAETTTKKQKSKFSKIKK
ncbi:UNVERIFIED_CONTAM: 3'-5' exonuclease [Kocuria sp. CPCC 205274]